MMRLNQYQAAIRRDEIIEGKTRDEIIEEYIPKVRLVASMIASKLAAKVEFDDLANAGLVGLLDAIDKFDPSRNIKFTTYAEFRIRGAILDSLRGMDLLTRTAREKANQLKKTIERLQRALSREPSRAEIAQALGLSMDGYYELLEEVKAVSVLSLDAPSDTGSDSRRSLVDRLADNAFSDPYAIVSEKDFRRGMKDAVLALPERLRQILLLYYYKELNFKEIGKVLSLSESRICQLHSEAILRLKARVERMLGEDDASDTAHVGGRYE